MKQTKHSVVRQNQRGFSPAMARVIAAYGRQKGDRIILTQKVANARLIEARAEKATLNHALDTGCSDMFGTLRQLEELTAEISVLLQLIDKHGGVVVVDGDTLITIYRLH